MFMKVYADSPGSGTSAQGKATRVGKKSSTKAVRAGRAIKKTTTKSPRAKRA